MTDLSWRYTFDSGPDFILVRARADDEPEIIGRVQRVERHAGGVEREGWTWSLTCHLVPVGIEPAAVATSGLEATKREACDALLAAWRIEEAWRAQVRAREDFEGLAPYVRSFVIHGQPTPAWRLMEIAREKGIAP